MAVSRHLAMQFTLLVLIGASLIFAGSLRQSNRRNISDLSCEKTGVVATGELVECSGLVAASCADNAFWAHNDSGNEPVLFLLDKTGKLLSRVEVQTAFNQDWEDISRCDIQGKQFLVVGDIGDNPLARKECQLLFIEEPTTINKPAMVAHVIHFQYEDGPHDCESLAFDGKSNSLLLCTKMKPQDYLAQPKMTSGFYAIKLPESLPGPTDEKIETAKRIANAPDDILTAMDNAPDGKRLILRSYTQVYVYDCSEKGLVQSLDHTTPVRYEMSKQRLGESIGFSKTAKVLWTISEGSRQPVLEICLPSKQR